MKKVFPWLASSESDFGLFLLYKAYIPNWSFCKREPRVRPRQTQDPATAPGLVTPILLPLPGCPRASSRHRGKDSALSSARARVSSCLPTPTAARTSELVFLLPLARYTPHGISTTW